MEDIMPTKTENLLNTNECGALFWKALGAKDSINGYRKLVQLRRHGSGPPCYKAGTGLTSAVLYDRVEVERWIERQHHVPMGEQNV